MRSIILSVVKGFGIFGALVSGCMGVHGNATNDSPDDSTLALEPDLFWRAHSVKNKKVCHFNAFFCLIQKYLAIS